MDLSIEGVSKSFPGVRALDDVSLDLKAGEIHALMGENGAGKSTLIKIITGVYRPDAGRVLLDGNPVEFREPRAALAAGIGAVHQERNLIPRFSVGENILLERLPTRNGLVDYETVNREARRFLDLLDRGIDTRVEVRTLSVAQMQIVEIAKALSLEAGILLMDEPTASITEHETAALFALLRKLRADGVAIVFVSHKLDEVFAIADRVTVLRDGKDAAAGEPMAAMTRQRLVSLMIGREERIAKPEGAEAGRCRSGAGGARPFHLDRAPRHRLDAASRARSSGSTASSAPAAASSRARSSAMATSPAASCSFAARRPASATCTRRCSATASATSARTESRRG